jgi:DNA-binding protein Alba
MQLSKQLEENLAIKTSEVKSKIKENQIFVGSKPFLKYVRSVEILLRNKNLPLITVRARGSVNIGKAVDLVEAVKHRFCPDLKLTSSATTSTEKFIRDEKEAFVSVIEVILRR